MTQLRTALTALALTTLGLATIGCGTNLKTVSSTVQGSAFQGKVYGGQQPLVGATMQLYAASANGYGQPYTYPTGTSLLGTNVVTTGNGGAFNITGDYTCPSYNTQVYLTATGGNPGITQGSNPNIALIAALGPCGALSANTSIVINELTTVASVWALSPFMSSISGVGTSAGNTAGLANAFATVSKLVNVGTGTVSGPSLPPGAVVPAQKMNLIADILVGCVNSAGGVATDTSTPCGALFSATAVNGIAPTDTVTAAMNLAQNPNLGVSLGTTVSPLAPFQPTPANLPGDFGLVITYSGGALSTPAAIAADAAGNLWIPNEGNNTVSKLDALGTSATDPTGFLSGNSGFTTGPLSGPAGVAIDQSGSAWVTNGGNNTVTEISPNGSSGTVFSGGSMNAPSGVAIDASGNVWVTNSGGTGITKITPGTTPAYANYNGAGIAAPSAIAINPK
jgi:hypothetical protein